MSAYDDGYKEDETEEQTEWQECSCNASEVLRMLIDTTIWDMVQDGEAEVAIDEDGAPVYYLIDDDGTEEN